MDLILQRNDSIQQHWYDHCIKSDHPNSMICPNTTEFYPETEQAEIETEKLKYTIKKGKSFGIFFINPNFRNLVKQIHINGINTLIEDSGIYIPFNVRDD